MNRRRFLFRSGLAAFGSQLSAQETPRPVQVRTSLGELRGSSEQGVHVFRGVPFAQPPVGPLRFRAPQPAKPWPGVRDAVHFAAAAMQPGDAEIPQSEDCLYLNIWAPSSGGPHPVFVWIHGGGFTGGRSFDPLSDGTLFAQQGVVCVTLAYRLGVFGFLDLGSQLGSQAGPAYSGGANHALQDLILALAWVQTNIGAFGGDPGHVTLGGESAGAKLTDLLMGIPSAAPLFAQMISESGGAERVYPPAQSAEVATGFCRTWTADTGLPPASLLTAPARQLIAAQEHFIRDWPAHFPLRAEIDGTFLQRSPLDAIRAGSSSRKRLLLGTNLDESAAFLGPHPGKDPGAADLGNLPVPQFRQVEAQYAQLYPGMPAELQRIRSLTAEEYWVPSIRVADAHVDAGGAAFVYRLDLPAPSGRFSGYAFHSYDLRFVWDRFTAADAPTPAEQQLANTMHAAWLAFIRTGKPEAPGLPDWPAYSTTKRPTMLFNAANRVANNPQGEELALWNGLLTH